MAPRAARQRNVNLSSYRTREPHARCGEAVQRYAVHGTQYMVRSTWYAMHACIHTLRAVLAAQCTSETTFAFSHSVSMLEIVGLQIRSDVPE